jgi:parvulin-like peptidyl-prolyl isomerase
LPSAAPLIAAALTAVLLLCGCGSSSPSKSTSAATNASEQKKAAEGKIHGVQMFPPPKPPAGDEQAAVVRVGSEPITRATYVKLTKNLTPSIASYEPKSRSDCSSLRARKEVSASKEQLKKLSTAQLAALCVRQKQAVVRANALEQLISSRWVIGEAADRGVGVSESEASRQVDKYVAVQFKSKAEYLRYLKNEQLTPADKIFEIRASMAGERLQGLIERKAKKRIDDAAIARYYRTHKASFEVPEKRDIRVVRTWTHSAIASAMAEVRHGTSIAEVAKRVSIDKPSNEHGGLIAGVVKGQEEQGLDQAIFKAKPHELIGPLHLRKRYYAFEVDKITPARIKPFRQIEGEVREALAKALLEEESAAFIAAFHKKWIARTSCAPGYVISRCKEWRGARHLEGKGVG